jgi:hypothetical protein
MMSLSIPESWSRFSVAVLLALLTAGLVAPGRVEASCSHYVTWKGAAIEGLDDLSLLRNDGVTPSAPGRQDAPAAPSDRRGPCTGVLCSGSPAPLVPATDVPPQGDDWCLSAGLLVQDKAEPFGTVSDDGHLRPVHSGRGIFHPPRTPLPHPTD